MKTEKCNYCSKDKIKRFIKDNLGEIIITDLSFMPTVFHDGYVCFSGCHRLISVEEWYEIEKEVMADFYGPGLRGMLRKFCFMLTHSKKESLRIADDFLDELKPYLKEA